MNENQKKIYEISEAIFGNDDYSSELYYQVMCKKCKNLDKYFEQFNLDNPLDRITVAQEWMNFDIVERELQRLNLSEYQKSKIAILNKHNGSLFETLNIKILEPKYAFLDNILDFITIYFKPIFNKIFHTNNNACNAFLLSIFNLLHPLN